MAMRNHLLNRIVAGGAVGAIILFVLLLTVPLDTLIVGLNGIFAGAMAAIVVAYWRLLWNAVLGVHPYDRVRQMTIGFFLCWLAYCVGVLVSVYLRSSGADINTSVLTAISRYIAIWAAVLQVTAPDFGLGIFYGRDRKVLTAGIVAGLITGLFVVYAQEATVLAS